MNEYIVEAYNNPQKEIWIFFDEFNTTDSIGVICEILCERTLLGQ
jgi:hypothetical protein